MVDSSLFSGCGILLKFKNDLYGLIGGEKCALMLVVYGSTVNRGCMRFSDIDLLLVIYDNCSIDRDAIEELVNSYKREGISISLNIVKFSDLLETLTHGDSLILKAMFTGYPLAGYDVFNSLRRFASSFQNSLHSNKDLLMEKLNTLIDDAVALLNLASRDLYSACGRVKTALGYILTFKTGHYDPDKAAEILASHEISKAYRDVSELCRLILEGSVNLSKIKRRIEDAQTVIRRALKKL